MEVGAKWDGLANVCIRIYVGDYCITKQVTLEREPVKS